MNKIYYWGARYKKQIQFVLFAIAVCIIIFSKSQFAVGVSEGFATVLLLRYIGGGFLYIGRKYKEAQH